MFVVGQSEHRLWRVTACGLLVWFLSWTPYAFLCLLAFTGHRHIIPHQAYVLPGILCKMSAAINPLIYGLL